jgi:translocation and assembly module TamB
VRLNGQGAIDGTTPFAITAQFDRFALLARVDRRIDISGQAKLSLAEKKLAIDGQLTVDRGLIDITQLGAPALSDDVVVIRRRDAAKPAATTSATQVAMNLVLGLGKDLRLIGRGIDTRLAGELTLTTPGGVLTAVGNVRTEGGLYDAYGQKLSVERGIVRFVGPISNPLLDILALRPNRDNDDRVGVAITGTALQPRVKLYAVPERSDTDKLAMLVLGRNFDELGRDETALIQTAAIALLSGERAGLSSRLGLDTLSVRQAASSGSNTKDVVITVGKQISDKVYVGYEQGIAGTAGTVQLIYRISQRLTLRAQAGKEDSSLDAILTFRWR